MKIQNMMKPSAQVVRIVNLSKGDVYKRVEKSNYSDPKLLLGVVREVLVSEEETTVIGVEYQVTYGKVTVNEKVMTGDTDALIYPATPEEVAAESERLRETLEKRIREQELELEKAQKDLARFASTEKALIDGMLQAPEIETVQA